MFTEVASKFLESLLLALAPVLGTLIGGLLLVQIKKVWEQAKAARPDVTAMLEMIAPMIVKAAEQAKLSGFIEDKKKYALELFEQYLAEQGLQVDVSLIVAALEAAVYQEFNREKNGDTIKITGYAGSRPAG